jgi:hypothetical protein
LCRLAMTAQPNDTRVAAYIAQHLYPGTMTADPVKDPFVFLGIRSNCTVYEVDARYRQLVLAFHHSHLAPSVAAFIQQHNVKDITEQDCVCQTYVLLCSTVDAAY